PRYESRIQTRPTHSLCVSGSAALPLPRNLQNALQALEGDELIRGVLGEEVVQRYLRHKENEWAEFESEIHTWEIDKYLARY
ncbi:MAG: glutamine synthetase, partial [Candidatus Desulforudis sp.]|nr:glutamine synthetase [Desulforudis sp.]